MGTSGDKIVLLDGMGSGSGSAANGLLSMIPGMFTSLLGGNKMDPNLVAALMNGRNNQDQFGGANGWWLRKEAIMAYVSKIGSLYELVTKNVVVTTANTVFGINPRIWLSLPCEGLLLLKIRQVVPTTGEALPVQIAVPANSTVSTVGDDTCCPVTGVAVVNPINVAVTGAAMVNNTERLVYFNKVRGVLRLMDCCVPTTAASASETDVDE